MPCPNPKCPTHYHGRHLNKHFAEKAVCRLYVLNQKNVVHPSLDSPPDDSIVVARDGPPTETETWPPPIPGSVVCTSMAHSTSSGNEEEDNAVDSLPEDEGTNSPALPQPRTYNFLSAARAEVHATPGTGNSAPANCATRVSSEAFTCTLGGTTYLLGRSFAIGSDESFGAVKHYPKHLPGMARILQTLRVAGCPLYVLDVVLKTI